VKKAVLRGKLGLDWDFWMWFYPDRWFAKSVVWFEGGRIW